MAYRFLKSEDILRIRRFDFAVKAMVEGYLSGRHRSKQRGASIEFHEYRAYTHGDDPSLVDWRVFARNERYYLKTFEQETNMECHLFVDSSASMGFQNGADLSKLEFCSFFAACMAWLVINRNDRVSLHTFDDTIRNFLPPGGTRRHLHNILSQLEDNKPGGQTSLPTALRRAAPLLRRKGTLIILSDFFDDPAETFAALNPYLHRGFRIHLCHVLDPAEQDLPNRGLTRFVDMENGQRLTLHPAALRKAWREQINNHISRMRRLATSREVNYALVTTRQSYHALFDHILK